ncbi:MAG: hypothetical protein EOL97_16295 [Spirochaetia bacterium]|nr:hypothetical protein [Spirochaetia bacterium]
MIISTRIMAQVVVDTDDQYWYSYTKSKYLFNKFLISEYKLLSSSKEDIDKFLGEDFIKNKKIGYRSKYKKK